jgi:hypothetical protein
VRFALVWTFGLLALSAPFLYRMLMIRTQGAAVLFLLIALILLFQQRYRWLLVLGFANAWLYDGFVLLPAVVVLYGVAAWLAERRLRWQPLVYVAAGTVLGLLINPYFPQNLLFIINHLGAKVDLESGVRVGNEWYPYTTAGLLENSLGALLVLAVGIMSASANRRTRDTQETTLLLVALLTLWMVFNSRRFIEYFPPFALATCAVSWGRVPDVDLAWIPSKWLRRAAWGAALIAGVYLAKTTLDAASVDVANSKDARYMAGAAAWLEQNTPAGTLVFQTDWDDFPYLYYHNTHNIYLIGLDPTYLQLYDAELWDLWVAITRGQVAQPSAIIASRFHAAYVVSDTRHDDFVAQIRYDEGMQLVYRDQYSYIWQIVDGTAS